MKSGYLTEYELFRALRPLFPPAQYALLPQVANGTGFGIRHMDGIAIGLWPSRGLHLHGFEIKSYRGDWLRELKKPSKAEDFHQFCNFWWIVAAHEAVVKDEEELPDGWGLFAYDGTKQSLKKKRPAKFKESKPADLSFIAAILRQAQSVITPDAALAEARSEGLEAGKKERDHRTEHDIENYQTLKTRVRDFEEATGLNINTWRPTRDICSAIQLVLNGSEARHREQLLTIAEHIIRDLSPQRAHAEKPLTVSDLPEKRQTKNT
jgi:hypothetical protein